MRLIIFLGLTISNVFAISLRDLPSSPEATPSMFMGKQNVGADHFPYQVCIAFQQSFNKRALCSGSLIGNKWILTAAYCATDAVEAIVYLGASNGVNAKVMHVVTKDDIIIHPSWDPSTGNNDITLIQIPHTLYTAEIQPVKLPSASSFHPNYNGDRAIAIGWHHELNTYFSSNSKLKWTSLEVSPKKICTRLAGAVGPNNTICAVAEELISACSSDHGGPLVLEFSKVQIGLNTLRSQNDCFETYVKAFIRVSDYLAWIESKTGIAY